MAPLSNSIPRVDCMRASAVIGGGVLGLSMARALRERGDEVVVYEASPELGGLASAWTIGDVTWDRHYHVTLASDKRTRALLSWLDLEQDLRWAQTRTGFYAGREHGLRSVSSPTEFLRLPTLGPIDKARLAGTIVYGSRVKNGERLERVGIERWLRRWSGDATFENFWVPLLRAKMGDAWTDASAAFMWATMRRLTAARRQGMRREEFGYVSGGYARIFDRFEERLTDLGVKLRVGEPVHEVVRADGRIEVRSASGAEAFDSVVVTTAAPLAAALCPDLSDAERRRLEAVTYVGVVCSSLLLRAALSPYYLTYVTDSATPFTGVVEMTAMVDPGELGGMCWPSTPSNPCTLKSP